MGSDLVKQLVGFKKKVFLHDPNLYFRLLLTISKILKSL